MMNFLKKVKNLFSINPVKETNPVKEGNTPVTPGTGKSPKEDIGKKVFEKTGKLREGIAQSSTVIEPEYTSEKPQTGERFKPQGNPSKHHGIRKRKNVVETSNFKSNPSNKDNVTPGNKNSPARRKPKYKQRSK